MNPELKAILEGLKKEYLKNLPDKIRNMTELWNAAELDLLETEFHKLKGTGKTYGLPEISELGLIAEEMCSAEPDQRDRAIGLALKVLGQIHDSRNKGREPVLADLPEFRELTLLSQSQTR